MRPSRLTCRALVVVATAVAVSTACAPHSTITATTPIGGPFTLEPGDVVRTLVWREKDLSGNFTVDELGRLTLPMVGRFNVSGRPWALLQDSLLDEYARQLRNPSVTLTPLRRVQVLGEVTKPGQYLADPTLSLAGLVALAGGATPNGDLHRVRVIRSGQTIAQSASVENLLSQGVHSNDQVFVDRRGWLERNGAFVASALISTAGIIVALIR